MKKYKVIYNDGPANKLFYSFVEANTDMEIVLKILWFVSDDEELIKLQKWLDENNKNITVKQLAELNTLTDLTIMAYIDGRFFINGMESGTYIQQIINCETGKIIYNSSKTTYCQNFYNGDDSGFYDALKELQ